jgi:two-component system NtrC family sensor kinase
MVIEVGIGIEASQGSTVSTASALPNGPDTMAPIRPRSGRYRERGHERTVGEPANGHFVRMRRRLQWGLLFALTIPLLILSCYFHLQFNYTLKTSRSLHLTILAESQRNTIDLFLQERVINILNLYRRDSLNLSPTEDDMRKYLQDLIAMSDAFIDLGFMNASGTQFAYAGPYPELRNRDYSSEKWFVELVKQDRNYLISDIYRGFRDKPHFTIAVKQVLDGNLFVIRATLDPERFRQFIRTIGERAGIDSALTNREGHCQVAASQRSVLLDASTAWVPQQRESNALEMEVQGESLLLAHAWLREVPWALVVHQPLSVAYARMYELRRVLILANVILVIVLGAAIWFATNRLVGRIQRIDESRRELRLQLLHASKLVAVGELAGGVAHEINNPLAIIHGQSGVIRDMLNPEFGLECTPDLIRQELAHIDNAVFRARTITQKLLNFVHKSEAKLELCDLNELLMDVISGVKEREFRVNNIELLYDLSPSLPRIYLDPDKIRQVLLNILNNAGDAMEGGGTISLTTRADKHTVRVVITDSGKGMTVEEMDKIFIPFFTTKEVGKGTGLGLSISLTLVQAMGGHIEVQSMPDRGSSFIVILPTRPMESA